MGEKWVEQIVEAVSFAHSKEVILDTLHLSHFGVDDEDNIKLVRTKHRPLGLWEEQVPETKLSPSRLRNLAFIPTKEPDVFQLGLILWLLADIRAAIPPRNQKGNKNEVFWERRARPGGCPEDAGTKQPSTCADRNFQTTERGQASYFCISLDNIKVLNLLILSITIGWSTDTQDGPQKNSPWIYPPPKDTLEDLNFDFVSPPPGKIQSDTFTWGSSRIQGPSGISQTM